MLLFVFQPIPYPVSSSLPHSSFFPPTPPPIDQRNHPVRLSLGFASGYPMLPENCGTNNNRCIEIKITTSKPAGRTVITKLLVKYRLWNTLNERMTWDAA